MNITIVRIQPPKFKIGRVVINEYELRKLMLDVYNGKQASGVEIKDEKGQTAIINEDGTLSTSLYGLDIMAKFNIEAFRKIKIQKKDK